MMELDPKYADVIVHRFADKAGDGEVFLLRDGEKIPYAALRNLLDFSAIESHECDASRAVRP